MFIDFCLLIPLSLPLIATVVTLSFLFASLVVGWLNARIAIPLIIIAYLYGCYGDFAATMYRWPALWIDLNLTIP